MRVKLDVYLPNIWQVQREHIIRVGNNIVIIIIVQTIRLVD